jgi:hypothetical protein
MFQANPMNPADCIPLPPLPIIEDFNARVIESDEKEDRMERSYFNLLRVVFLATQRFIPALLDEKRLEVSRIVTLLFLPSFRQEALEMIKKDSEVSYSDYKCLVVAASLYICDRSVFSSLRVQEKVPDI